MDQKEDVRVLNESLKERLLREALRTPPLKEALLVCLRDVDPGTAPGFVKAVLWEDPVLFMSLFGALPDTVNWLLEFVVELGRQLGSLPAPLLQDFAGLVRDRIDTETAMALPGAYGPLVKRLLEDDRASEKAVTLAFRAVNASLAKADGLTAGLEADGGRAARALARGLDELDTAALRRVLARLFRLAGKACGFRMWNGVRSCMRVFRGSNRV